MSDERYEAAGRYVIDHHGQRISGPFADFGTAMDNVIALTMEEIKSESIPWSWIESIPTARASVDTVQAKPADCPEHYWAAPYQCMEVRDAILERIEAGGHVSLTVAADWAVVFQYVWRCMFKGQTVSDLRKIEHYARILRERLEGGK